MSTITPRRRPRSRRQATPRFSLRVTVSLDRKWIVAAAITLLSLAAALLTVAQFLAHTSSICVR